MFISLSDSLAYQAVHCPEKEALLYKKKWYSYAEFNAEVNHQADLLARVGLVKGDRVAVYLEKSIEEAVALMAINRAGGVFVDINHLLKADQVKYILDDSQSRFLFTSRQRLRGIAPILEDCYDLEALILHGPGDNPKMENLVIIDRTENPFSKSTFIFPHVVETDIGAIIYTSGSTGNPKGVILSQRNLLAGAESVANYLENSPEDRILSVLPFSFDYGLNQLTTSIYVGATCVLINYLLPNDILKALEEENITGLGLIPPLWLQLLQKKWDHLRFPSLRYLTNTGGAMPESAVRELRKRLPDTKIYLMFGLTEAFRGTYLPPDQVDKRPSSIGKAIPNAEIWVLDKDGKHCKPGEEGELVQRGAHVAMGYWNDPKKTAERFKNNPFSPNGLPIKEKAVFSGDTVWKDEEGYLYYKGRTDEMIKTSGYRVSPSEVEEVLYATGDVKHAVAFGIPDELMGQVIVAAVSLRDGGAVEENSLLNTCTQKLPKYMVPKQIEIWENLPLNPNGKLDRKKIRSEFEYRKKIESAKVSEK